MPYYIVNRNWRYWILFLKTADASNRIINYYKFKIISYTLGSWKGSLSVHSLSIYQSEESVPKRIHRILKYMYIMQEWHNVFIKTKLTQLRSDQCSILWLFCGLFPISWANVQCPFEKLFPKFGLSLIPA